MFSVALVRFQLFNVANGSHIEQFRWRPFTIVAEISNYTGCVTFKKIVLKMLRCLEAL